MPDVDLSQTRSTTTLFVCHHVNLLKATYYHI